MNTTQATPAEIASYDRQITAWARRDGRKLADALLSARTVATAVRAEVNARLAPIFARYDFRDDTGAPIASPERLYRCEDDVAVAAYYGECNAANVAAGWKGNPEHCPALTAEHEVIKREREILESYGAALGLRVPVSTDLRDRMLALALDGVRLRG